MYSESLSIVSIRLDSVSVLCVVSLSESKTLSPIVSPNTTKPATFVAGLLSYGDLGSPYGAYRVGRTFRPAPLRMLDVSHSPTAELRAPSCLPIQQNRPQGSVCCLTATWARTKDLLLRRQLLYPTELLPHCKWIIVNCPHSFKCRGQFSFGLVLSR